MLTFAVPFLSQDIALLDLDAMKTFERAQFVEHQNARRLEAAKALESSMEKVPPVLRISRCTNHRGCVPQKFLDMFPCINGV